MKRNFLAPPFFISFFLLTLCLFQPAFAEEPVPSEAILEEVSKDIYYPGGGPVSGSPAPKMSYPESYGRTGGIDGRSLLWFFIQQHFFMGSFILGVPMIAWPDTARPAGRSAACHVYGG